MRPNLPARDIQEVLWGTPTDRSCRLGGWVAPVRPVPVHEREAECRYMRGKLNTLVPLRGDQCHPPVDAANDDYRLKPESPAFKLGFKPILVEKIGPRDLETQ